MGLAVLCPAEPDGVVISWYQRFSGTLVLTGFPVLTAIVSELWLHSSLMEAVINNSPKLKFSLPSHQQF